MYIVALRCVFQCIIYVLIVHYMLRVVLLMVRLYWPALLLFCLMQTARRVNRVGARIVEASGLKSTDWEFLVVEDEDTRNAFALPGGKVSQCQRIYTLYGKALTSLLRISLL